MELSNRHVMLGHLLVRHLNFAHIAQSAEHFLGKEEVTGSSPVMGSRVRNGKLKFIYRSIVSLRRNFNVQGKI